MASAKRLDLNPKRIHTVKLQYSILFFTARMAHMTIVLRLYGKVLYNTMQLEYAILGTCDLR